MKIPAHGLDRASIDATLETYRADDMRWRTGRTFAYVYDAGREAEEVGKAAYASFLTENGLDPTAFPSLLRLETELVSMVADHLRGGPGAVGSFTSGGTESILCAVKAARDHARAERPGVTAPEILLPTTAHAAFHKAAHYFGLKKVLVPVTPGTYRADPAAMAAAVTDQTVLMVGSAPSYAHGVVDPIPEMAAVARDAGVLFHVDACVGGFLLPYYRRLGVEVPDFDLAVPGVTSLSVDLHKYAFCPKGASLVLYNDARLRHYQIFACSDWTGYTVVNPTVQSSKTGGPMAAAWAVLNFLGDAGYLEIARQTLEGTRALVDGIRAIDGLDVMGEPDFCLVAASSDALSVFHVIDEMKVRGWHVQPQLSYDTSQENIHFSLHPGNARQVAPMLADLAEAVDVARQLPATPLAGQVASMFRGMAGQKLAPEMFVRLLAMAGIDGVGLPERMAEINEVMNALPRPVSEQLLTAFVNDLYRIR